jgi:hypothetical protein
MQGPSRIIAARIERHPFGRELVIAFEGPDDARNVIETCFERVNFLALQQRADDLRNLLAAKGWVEVRGQRLRGDVNPVSASSST